MPLDEALQEHEEKVDALIRSANRYVGALKSWKKACQVGHIANLQKSSALADEIGAGLPETTRTTRTAWNFDIRDYLETDEWQTELRAAAEKLDLRTLLDEDTIISSPVTVKALPNRSILALGKVSWPAIRPKIVAAELKKLRDRTAAANSQEFCESLFGACQHLGNKDNVFAKFIDIYNVFSLTPGYKKENSKAAFAQQIYALQRSNVRATRGGRPFEIEGPTGSYKQQDVFSVLAEDGRTIRYYSIWFK